MMKNNKLFHAVCILIIFLSALGVYIWVQQSTPDIKNNLCTTGVKFKTHSDGHSFEYDLFLRLNFIREGKGYENMRGEVISDGQKYTVARTLNFSYRNRNSHNYEVTIDSVKKTGQDNLTENLAIKHLSYTLPRSFIILRIDEISRYLMLVSGPQGPIFICVLA